MKFISLSNEPYMARPTLIDLNPVRFNYYPFIISLDKCNVSSNNAVDDLSLKVCILSKTTGVNLSVKGVKVFNMIPKINETNSVKYFSCDCKCKFNSAAYNSNKKWNNKTCEYEWKNYQTCKEDYSWNPNTYSCENGI